MIKNTTILCCIVTSSIAFGQWTPLKSSSKIKDKNPAATSVSYYKLDLVKIRKELSNAQETGPNAKAIEIFLPTLSGTLEKFAVYSFPVMTKELTDQYQLGSYVGIGIDDPSQYVRFSVSPNDFQSMLLKNGETEFINIQDKNNNIYAVHLKSKNIQGFYCRTEESPFSIKEIQELKDQGKSFNHQPADFSKSSDQKFRTMRLAISTTGEYTQHFGGTLAGTLTGINATMTRVNGIFEKDLAVHLNVQNYPNIIYIDPATDPYSNMTENWNLEVQNVLTTNVGNTGYDIGHLFAGPPSGNEAGNAGCIGCVCNDPTTTTPIGKGSGFTSAFPSAEGYDFDLLAAHELAHQLGANHTFSHKLENYGTNVEPGSGSTIMGYPGMTALENVQSQRDEYFHHINIKQIQLNLNNQTCDIETPITNNPPVIEPLPTYTIPKGTAFLLTASATDMENDPLTYTWEQIDNADINIYKGNLGTTTNGPAFRSIIPNIGPTRYFPKLASVLDGILDNSNNEWESVSMIPRTMKFAVTVRDNHPTPTQQQSAYAEQTVIVSNDDPFKITTQYVYYNTPSAIEWDMVNTNAAPYNVTHVKIDYTADNGTTWTILSPSTVNDGAENVILPALLNGQNIKIRVSAIGNIFYAVKEVLVTTSVSCDGAAPSALAVNITSATSAHITWAPVSGAASYSIRYKKLSELNWQETNSNTHDALLNNLTPESDYEVQVASVCSGTTGTYSNSVNFSLPEQPYCTAVATAGLSNKAHISNITIANINNNSSQSFYRDYTTDVSPVNLTKDTSSPLSVTVSNSGNFTYAVRAYIDFNKNGNFEESERVLYHPTSIISAPITSTVSIPSDAVENKPLRMRIILHNVGFGGLSETDTCGNFQYGEVEDYNVIIAAGNLAVDDSKIIANDIQLYPNPVSDMLNITNVSDKVHYKIHSITGQLIDQGIIINGQINVSKLLTGTYYISIEEKNKDSYHSKFIKK
ncbi:T9SS C-terminal target domain-containing protein [Chryseobacterium nematophagum]|uniref:T9SS C-terminal target domain-containing protein n=1 Tax=Chryseobacterium nematophagum TaxID=2305228 RepID=A0A3M7TL38_9FLAO|nr:zinc-dependent metalloprotease family protein [Chryseobacterium nematophagum]RNA63369.1 T9SS C-terminal target domain-containing protein [Chryseobacterium nematophagum]